MTTKLRTRRFRASAAPRVPAPVAPPAMPARQPAQMRRASPSRAAQATPAAAPDEPEIDAIRAERLTGRQLRLARRVALKHNLAPSSDFDAVRLLRARGIDPFNRANTLELLVPAPRQDKSPPGQGGDGPVMLPQTVDASERGLPSTELAPAQGREREIKEIQRDIARRRGRKLRALALRLFLFVGLPTMLAGLYFNIYATPMYASKSEFLILQADNMGGSGLGGLLTGTQFATNQDAIAVQSYLQSKDAMLRLDRDAGLRRHFSDPRIDAVQRLPADATNEATYDLYRKRVKIGYDPTEGVIRMEVSAANPWLAKEFSERLISYAEERVNDLSQQKRGDQMDDAMVSFQQAEAERRRAQQRLVDLQVRGALLDPQAAIAAIRGQITNVEMQLQEKQLQLSALLDNLRPNRSRVEGAQADIGRLSEMLHQLNARMTDMSKGENSLAALSVRIQMAQADLATRDMMLQSALQQVEQTRMEANRQVRYLTTSVLPVASQKPSYPRGFENTALAFVVFTGIYLMISLTASILKEQVTS